jgi:site-specific DNA recombinase
MRLPFGFCRRRQAAGKVGQVRTARQVASQMPLVAEQIKQSHAPNEQEADRTVLLVPWRKTPSKRRREIIPPKSTTPLDTRPIRAETRAKLIASVARGRRWLDEIAAGAVTDVEQIAAREKCSVRKVNMTISLAFLTPDLVKAAVEGRLPRGIGVARLCDAPAEWSRQYRILGLPSP